MRVSVITTVRDGEDALPALFDALDRQSLPRSEFEVVVIDNASRDRTAEIARERHAVVVSEPVPGRARARNTGVAAARSPLLAFTDADCRPRARWLEALLGCLERVPLAGGPVKTTTRREPNAVETFERLWRFRQEANVSEGWSVTANLGMRRDVFEEIGGFDATMRLSGEDVDLCLRAGAAGHAIGWCPDAVVEHPAETSLRPVLRRAYEHSFGLEDLHRRHGRTPGRYWRHPGPLLRGDHALTRFGVDLDEVPEAQRPRVLRVARADYGARMAGSLRAQIRGSGRAAC